MKLFLSPHHDDAVLFGAFTLLGARPKVLTILGSQRQPERFDEDAAACEILGVKLEATGVVEELPNWDVVTGILRSYRGVEVCYAPAFETDGHEHHNIVAGLADQVFPNVVHYMTYTRAGKSTGRPVPYDPAWVALKLRAIACYESQIRQRNQVEHFLREQQEYYQA